MARNVTLLAVLAASAMLAGTAGAAEVFSETFDSGDLSANWDVIRPDDAALAVEGGELLLLSSRYQPLAGEEISNVLLSKVALPVGDWTLSLAFSGEFRTAAEELLFGVARDVPGENDVWAAIGTSGDKYDGWSVYIAAGRHAGERSTLFRRPIFTLGCNVCPPERMFPEFVKTIPQPIEARLAKTGRQYVLSARLGPDMPWQVTERITAIDADGRLFIVLRQRQAAEGETFVKIDYVTLETP